MADEAQTIDPKNGFCSQTKTFHSIRSRIPLPPPSQPLSITNYALSLLRSSDNSFSDNTTAFLVDAATGRRLSYADFILQIDTLASALQAKFPSLFKAQVAFVLSPPSLHIPVLYFALMSLGLTVSPANPLSTQSELTHLFQLTKPVIAFADSSVAHKLPPLPLGTVILDSPEFLSLITPTGKDKSNYKPAEVNQSDSAAILYSSGTTGRVKGVELSHRNLISVIAGLYYHKFQHKEDREPPSHPVSLFILPMFHVFGFFMLIRAASLGETLVVMERFDFEKMLMTVEKYKITYMPVSPPLVVAMVKSDLVNKYDISSLELLGCGGAALGKEVAENFASKFPTIEIVQGYGMTETGGAATAMSTPDETKKYGSAGRLINNLEAKIVDPTNGEVLTLGQRGELWLRGPMIMKGYVGDKEATAATLDSEGWLKTGDLCYFDSDGFLYIVDRLKELIKYKAYQVPPAELEHILQSIPEIADAAVIPYPDEEAGEIPMAYVVRKPGSNITASQIMDIVAKQVSPYKKIRRLAFINAIPKSPAGKILRRELVNHALSAGLSRF
jgi:acyl-CoA synthetase (AMP-forming)/AMP-acid ligase II